MIHFEHKCPGNRLLFFFNRFPSFLHWISYFRKVDTRRQFMLKFARFCCNLLQKADKSMSVIQIDILICFIYCKLNRRSLIERIVNSYCSGYSTIYLISIFRIYNKYINIFTLTITTKSLKSIILFDYL